MNYNDSVDILTRYIKYLKIPVTRTSIEEALKIHPYCGSLLAITDVLNSWNIPNEAFSVRITLVNKIPLPFIACLSSNNGEFVFVEASKNGGFKISNKHWEQLSIPIDEFEKLFTGEVIVAENDKQSGEISYPQKRQKEILNAKALKASLQETPHLKPSFIVIGAQKAGTTSFYEYLKSHPDFKSSSTKELHFFNLNYTKGTNWYHDHFPPMISDNEFTGEASPCYQFHPLVPQRVFKYSPNIKIVSLLRNPVERAYSHYWMNVSQGTEKLSFEDAIALEEQRIKPEFQKIITQKNYNSFNCQTFSYLNRGIYSEQIKLWLKYFSKDKFFFVHSEQLKLDPDQVLHDFCKFANVPEFNVKKVVEVNSRNYPKMLPETKIKLEEYFKPYNEELNELTGINFL